MTDLRDTPPACPQRPSKPTPASSPLIHHPPDAADTEQPEPPEQPEQPPAPSLDWYEQAIARIPSSPATDPTQRRGKVAVKLTDQGFELASQDADVLVHYEKPKAIASATPPPEPPPEPEPEPTDLTSSPAPGVFPDLAVSMVLWCAGFVCALLLVGIGLLGSDRPVIIVPSVQGGVE
jgi:hypothetical protein